MCKIKRTELNTIAQANRIIQDMCLVSSTDCSVVHEEKTRQQISINVS